MLSRSYGAGCSWKNAKLLFGILRQKWIWTNLFFLCWLLVRNLFSAANVICTPCEFSREKHPSVLTCTICQVEPIFASSFEGRSNRPSVQLHLPVFTYWYMHSWLTTIVLKVVWSEEHELLIHQLMWRYTWRHAEDRKNTQALNLWNFSVKLTETTGLKRDRIGGLQLMYTDPLSAFSKMKTTREAPTHVISSQRLVSCFEKERPFHSVASIGKRKANKFFFCRVIWSAFSWQPEFSLFNLSVGGISARVSF